MKCIECPHCGQMQILNDSGRCIKCGDPLVGAENGPNREFGKIYICPRCGHLQEGKADYCEKCKGSMITDDPVAKAIALIFGVFAIIVALGVAWYCFLFIRDFSYYSSPIYAVVSIVVGVLVVIGCAYCFRFFFRRSKKNAQPTEKRFATIYQFLHSDGVSGVSFDAPGTMAINMETRQIELRYSENLKRTLDFSQVIGVSWGNYNYTEMKRFVGGVSVGGVFIHESPTSNRTNPFLQIKYSPSTSRYGSEIIRIVFPPLTPMERMHEVIAWIGFKLDEDYIVPDNQKL